MKISYLEEAIAFGVICKPFSTLIWESEEDTRYCIIMDCYLQLPVSRVGHKRWNGLSYPTFCLRYCDECTFMFRFLECDKIHVHVLIHVVHVLIHVVHVSLHVHVVAQPLQKPGLCC